MAAPSAEIRRQPCDPLECRRGAAHTRAVRVVGFRIGPCAALIGLLVVGWPMMALAQSSATPLLSTTPDSIGPSIPFGGFQGFQGYSDSVAAIAAQNKTSEVLGMLDAGHSADERDYLDRTGLMYAAINNNALLARILLGHHADIALKDKLGNTALHWAAERGSNEVMQVLLTAHAPVDAQNNQGITPLMLAVADDHARSVKLLLAAGADPHQQDYTGRDALGWTTDNRAIAQLLKNAH
jgi:uncharacterized protein